MECSGEGKSEEKSKRYQSEGDEFCSKLQYYEALLCYNKAICYTPIELRQLLAEIYAKRSQIYLQLKKREKCEENLHLARQCKISVDEFEDIEEKCKNLSIDCASENVWDDFKLSYHPHPKIPFIVSSLKMVETFKYGRCIITSEPLRPGDVIAIDEPLFRNVNRNHRYSRCANCMRSNFMSLIPCTGGCTATMFCSEACRSTMWAKSHKYECDLIDQSIENDSEYDLLIMRIVFESIMYCNGLEKLQTLLSDQKMNVNVFDFDWSKNESRFDIEKNLLRSVFSLKKGPTSEEDIEMADWIMDFPAIKALIKNKAQEKFLKSFIIKMMGIVDRNSYIFFTPSLKSSYVHEESGSGIFPFASLVNHSCSPNLYRIFVDNKQVFVVKKPIAAGQQLFVGYQPNFTVCPKAERQDCLMKEFQFKCSCDACSSNYPLMQDLEKCDANFHEPPESVDTIEEAKITIKRNCDYIEDKIKVFPFPCYELCYCMQNTFRQLQFIAGKKFLLNHKD